MLSSASGDNLLVEQENFRQERESHTVERQHWAAELAAIEEAVVESGKSTECVEQDETPAQPPEAVNPNAAAVDLQEVLRRLGHKVDFSEDDAAESQAMPAESGRSLGARQSAEGGAEPSLARSEPAADEEESIDTYMAQLMQRLGVKGPSADKVQPPTVAHEAPTRPAQPTNPAETSLKSEPTREGNWQRREPVELAPRAVAPEKHVDLSALRDLANLSAEHALGRHDRKQLIAATRSKLIVTVVALAVGVGLLWHWHSHNTGNLIVFAAMLSFLIALHWGLQYAILTGRLIINRSGRISLRKQHKERHPAVALAEVCGVSGGMSRPNDVPNAGPQANAKEINPASNGETPADTNAGAPTA